MMHHCQHSSRDMQIVHILRLSISLSHLCHVTDLTKRARGRCQQKVRANTERVEVLRRCYARYLRPPSPLEQEFRGRYGGEPVEKEAESIPNSL